MRLLLYNYAFTCNNFSSNYVTTCIWGKGIIHLHADIICTWPDCAIAFSLTENNRAIAHIISNNSSVIVVLINHPCYSRSGHSIVSYNYTNIINGECTNHNIKINYITDYICNANLHSCFSILCCNSLIMFSGLAPSGLNLMGPCRFDIGT